MLGHKLLIVGGENSMHRAGGYGTAGTAMAVPVFKGGKMALLEF